MIAGLAIAAVGFDARAADLFHENCETVEPTWAAFTQNGGTVEADETVKHGGKRSIKLSWTPETAIAPDGTSISQSTPTGTGYAAIWTMRNIKISHIAKYKLSYWVRTEGDIGWKNGEDNATLGVELRYIVNGKQVTYLMMDTNQYPEWTQITEFKTHQISENPNQVLVELTPPPGATDVELRFGLGFSNRAATIWIDDIQFTELSAN